MKITNSRRKHNFHEESRFWAQKCTFLMGMVVFAPRARTRPAGFWTTRTDTGETTARSHPRVGARGGLPGGGARGEATSADPLARGARTPTRLRGVEKCRPVRRLCPPPLPPTKDLLYIPYGFTIHSQRIYSHHIHLQRIPHAFAKGLLYYGFTIPYT